MMEMKTERGACVMGDSTDTPCPYPVAGTLPNKLPEGVGMCAFHLATEPLNDEANDLYLGLDLLAGFIKAAREDRNLLLVTHLERIEADFTTRFATANKVLDDLKAAELGDMRS